jgi:hypothetical protein
MQLGVSLLLSTLVALLPSTCGQTEGEQTDGGQTHGESVCMEDGTGGIHNVSDVPAGSCADSGKVCTLKAYQPCPNPQDLPLTLKWTCVCNSGSWSCSSTGETHRGCGPWPLDAGTD